jgi:hypothetical protein
MLPSKLLYAMCMRMHQLQIQGPMLAWSLVALVAKAVNALVKTSAFNTNIINPLLLQQSH